MSLHDHLRGALREVLEPGTPVALLHFPNHRNLGDSAIWVAQRRLLHELGHPVCVQISDESYNRRALRSSLRGGGVILLSGGGNFGDVWDEGQRFREQVVEDFRDVPVVQLPQAIHFRERAALARCRAVLRSHRQFTLMVRDRHSAETGRLLGLSPILVPDIAFGLGPLPRSRPTADSTLWLLRDDVESRAASTRGTILGVTDWPKEKQGVDGWARRATKEASVRTSRTRLTRAHRLLGNAFDVMARRRFERALTILSAAPHVVTDRLHGHILCLLLGIPHVLLDNSYGKVRSFYDTWTHSSSRVTWADTLADARRLAVELPPRLSGSYRPS